MKAMGIIFSNIYDSSLGELTNVRTVASLPFGGRYRQIDFVLSNMSNSGIYNVGIITKYNYRSLMDHLGNCADWDLNRKNEGVVFLPPFASGNTGVYKGKLEALYSAVHFINNPDYDLVVVCDSTILCNVDFRKAMKKHVQSGSDVTVVVNREPEKLHHAHPLVLKTDRRGKVTEMMIDAPVRPGTCVGMGMFIFNRALLIEALRDTYSRGLVHLERDYLQKRFNEGALKISTYHFDGVVLRNEDVRSYYANNMALLDADIRAGLFKRESPIYTKVRDEAPTYYGRGSEVSDCVIADGCAIFGSVKNSVLFRGVSVSRGSKIRGCIVMQGTTIGKCADLECVILDKNVTVTDGAVLKGTPEHPVIVQKGETV
ncbi:MAG: glucose-1-phosphate adenylyltransferase subunit GlgD [Clostridia bacterium]|nr:glucose-1-phosphate adenylyltransferase subunit GlgD [Clostridia bacterium]